VERVAQSAKEDFEDLVSDPKVAKKVWGGRRERNKKEGRWKEASREEGLFYHLTSLFFAFTNSLFLLLSRLTDECSNSSGNNEPGYQHSELHPFPSLCLSCVLAYRNFQ
jgi:hypothetical protein